MSDFIDDSDFTDDFESRLRDEYCFHCGMKKECNFYPHNLTNAQCGNVDELLEKIHLGID